MKLESHPTVQKLRASGQLEEAAAWSPSRQELAQLCRDAGVDDVGFVEIERPELAPEREDIEWVLPGAQSLIAFVVKMNREAVKSPARSLANLEFHHAGDEVNEVARRIVAALEERGIRAVNPSMGFPMEMNRFPGKIWVISHKRVAEAAGLGRMGIHRNIIHPRFGNFVLLGTVIVDARLDRYDHPIDYNPCLECKLCVSACPVGAIGSDGSFHFSSCYTHNYREFMSGFTDWTETVADSGSAREYRRRVEDPETASVWQSLSFGANYKAAYCLAVCPAGEEVIPPYLADKKQHLQTVVKPLQDKQESLYVLPDSDAEAHAAKRFPHKRQRRIRNGLRPLSIEQFLFGLSLVFQRSRAKGLHARYHFRFTGAEPAEATVVIRDQQYELLDGLQGDADFRMTADSEAWLRFLAKDLSMLGLLLRRRLRFRGSPRWLLAFARCFPV